MQIVIDGQRTRTQPDFYRQCASALGSRVAWRQDLDGLYELLVAGLPEPTALIWLSASASQQAMGQAFVELKEVLDSAIQVQRRFGWAGAFDYRLA